MHFRRIFFCSTHCQRRGHNSSAAGRVISSYFKLPIKWQGSQLRYLEQVGSEKERQLFDHFRCSSQSLFCSVRFFRGCFFGCLQCRSRIHRLFRWKFFSQLNFESVQNRIGRWFELLSNQSRCRLVRISTLSVDQLLLSWDHVYQIQCRQVQRSYIFC